MRGRPRTERTATILFTSQVLLFVIVLYAFCWIVTA